MTDCSTDWYGRLTITVTVLTHASADLTKGRKATLAVYPCITLPQAREKLEEFKMRNTQVRHIDAVWQPDCVYM